MVLLKEPLIRGGCNYEDVVQIEVLWNMRMQGILEALTEAQDGGEENLTVSACSSLTACHAESLPCHQEIERTVITKNPPYLPSELLNVIATALIDTQDLRTCAMLNRTCRDTHYGTLPTLWNTLVLQTDLGARPFVETEAWQELVSRKGFQHVKFFVLETLGASAFAVMTAPQIFESHEVEKSMQNVRAVIVTDSSSWPRPSVATSKNGALAKIKDGRFTGIRLTSKYTYASSDLYQLLYALGQGQFLVLHVFPSADSPSALPANSTNLFPFKAAELGPVAHIGCITLNLYHEPEEKDEYREITSRVMTEMLALVAYSRGLFDAHDVGADGVDFYEATTVDIIGVDGEMAVTCMEAFAAALRIAPGLATISLQLQMDILAPSIALTRRIISPLKDVYSVAMSSVGWEKAGKVKVSLVSGSQHVSVCLHPGGEKEQGGYTVLEIILTDYSGFILEKGELNSWLNADVVRAQAHVDIGSGDNSRLIVAPEAEHQFPRGGG
ncbi:hypothetical protein QFC22_006254 [Naganishia vaughanmartiniae]|uniref:Uncharacterized protein n=1 Tax=Naganishia vaughanmartiniae TaxID=1424756 RepID=A0ACC2WLK1_9TREE|nr:hypothetical protein QFC22_006254 [Naganishia vaughanmartiniae]